ncbi:hypothetical protein PABG_03128 [Paracoccidioides brasiliensis Pb03]|nr:hypothetical protein PABG_03128 [Paracoccidioides brasiliensis Pb03]
MGDQQNISQLLAALAAHQASTTAGQTSSPHQGQLPLNAYSGTYPLPASSTNVGNYSLPPPDNTGSLDISGAKPINTGSVSIADAIAKARVIAAEKGIVYDPNRGPPRGVDSRRDPRSYQRSRSPSRSPPRITRDTYRDNYNPYRDERRPDRRNANERAYARERSFSPRPGGRGKESYSPKPSRQYWGADDRSPPGRRAGSIVDDNVETISVESSLVGLIIGRQGESLRRIESDTGTRIQFLDNADPNSSVRLCKITGNRAAREDAKAEITRSISESGASRSSNKPPGHLPSKAMGQSPQDDEDAVRIMVPDRTVGLIIGRGGETIRDLQERSGCHVNIVNESKSINGLRPVNLIGSPEATERAKNFILEIVESDTRQLANPQQREQRPPYGDSTGGPGGEKVNDTIYIPPDAVGMIIGKGGDTIKEMQAITGCRINIQSPVGRDAEREVTLVGSRGAIEEAKRMIMEKIESPEYKSRSQPSRRDDSYGERYSSRPQQRQPYYQEQSRQAPQNSAPQPGSSQPGGEEDPYARWGGYQNCVAYWYATMQQQAQQQQAGQVPPGHSEPPPGPPGVS